MESINSYKLGTWLPSTGSLLKQWNTTRTTQSSYWSVESSWNVMAHAQKPDFFFRSKRTSPFKSKVASVQSNTGSRGVRISGSNAGYTMFRGSVKSTGYQLHSPISPSLSLPWVTACHHISTLVYLDWRVGLLFPCSDSLRVDGTQVPKMWELILTITYILWLLIECIIIIIYLSWSMATCWLVPVSRIQKSLQMSTMIPSAS